MPFSICFAQAVNGDCCLMISRLGKRFIIIFRRWDREAVWVTLPRSLYPLVRLKAGRHETPSIAIMDGQSVKTTEKGAFEALTAINESKEENDISWSIR